MTVKTTERRVPWIDYLKVIGMYFIILGHFFPPHKLIPFIYAFNVPLFFIASGYLCTKSLTTKELLRRLTPTFVLFVAFVSLNCLYRNIYSGEDIGLAALLKGLIIGDQSILNTMWFVYTLLLIRIIHNYAIRIPFLPAEFSIVCVTFLELIGPSIYKCNAILTILISLPFFEIGYYLSKYCKNQICAIQDLIGRRRLLAIAATLVLSVLLWFSARINGGVWMVSVGHGNFFSLCFINALLGTFIVFIVASLLASINLWPNLIRTMARGNITVLAFHCILIELCNNLLFPHLNLSYYCVFPAQALASAIILACFIPFDYLFCYITDRPHQKTPTPLPPKHP